MYLTGYALKADSLKPSNQLEPGIDDALEIIRHTEKVIAPVAWALFMGNPRGMNADLQKLMMVLC